ncbi:phage baseplate upper protein [Bacillus sp. FSL M8-0052]|uniref:Phage baseplate upper protein n=4 Tax=Bacillus glycinifermentans TaxID=1664069 RepID=A0AAJ3Z196_9BACI|nr:MULTISPECIES: phage baseplate upper protein [Bacillus]MDU0073262.1 phage baseplate upper protein [Bacillus sp. IG6]MED8021233.1 phage baseplate upper protein [Bacillus glycinifermentans]QAT66813.1 phage baseplate upper protein [Bacillus glycinifermentans]
MIYKEGEISFDINARKAAAKSTNIQFFTQDTGSAKLFFSFTKDGAPLPLSAVDAKIVLLYADDSFYKRSLTLTDKVNGKAEYVLSDEELKHHGQVRAEVKLYYTNGQALATVFFTFSIAKTLEDQNIVPVAEYYIDDVESFRDQISQTLEEIKARFDEFENIETKAGAQEKADAAEANAKAYTDQHAAKTDNPHKVTKSQVGLANVDNVKQAAKTAFDTHVADNVRHITADERTKWNAAQLTKITADDAGVSLTIGDGDDFYDKVTKNGKRFGTFYSTGKAQNIPTTLSARGLFHMTSTINGVGSYGYVIAVDWKNNVFSNYVDGTLGWQGWRRFLTDADISPTWNSVNLINGAKQDSLYPLKFSVSNNVLWLRGSFGTLPAIGTSVAKFTNKPTQTVDFVVPTIGSYGTARFSLTTDGDLRYDGMLANDETKVTRVSFNESIPLW